MNTHVICPQAILSDKDYQLIDDFCGQHSGVEHLARATELYDLFIIRATELGGVYSGEHGTGKRKRKDFLKLYGQSAIEQLKRCKAAIDPDFLVNRGNVFIP